jgi:hypothetical protein
MAKSIDEKVFYHGTNNDNVSDIEKEGLKYGDGILNQGVYISENWRIALWFGASLYQVKLKKGTRILDLSAAADMQVIGYLKREFGKELLKAENPWKVIPRNKRLKNIELINLMRYFFNKSRKKPLDWDRKTKNLWEKMDKAVHKCYRGFLIRHGYHGYGHPTNDIGYVIFDSGRIESAELIISVPQQLYQVHFQTDFKWFDNLEGLIRKVGSIKQ